MRIKNVKLKNYRQFKDIEISFDKGSDIDLHICIGVMGTGKTNLLNAINWCLYNDEPYLSRKSQQLPLLNLNRIAEAKQGEDKKVAVEVQAEAEEENYIIFTREAIFRVYGQGENPKLQETNFEVKVSDERGNVKILKNEEAESYVERFVPRKVREFFFFDGERLDKYFREATGENIRHVISVISQIDLLDRVYHKIEIIRGETRKEAGKVNPRINEIREDLERKENNLKEVDRQIEEFNRQIKIAKEKIEEYQEKLRDLPDTEKLEKDREELEQKRKEKMEILKEKIKERQDLLFEYSKIIMLSPALKNCISVIDEKKRMGEIPPIADTRLLKDILEKNVCSICGRSLDGNAKTRVEKLHKEIKLSSDIAKQLQDMEYPLISYIDQIKDFKKEIKRMTKEIHGYEKDLEEIECEIYRIDKVLSGYNTEKIKEWHIERKKFENVRDEKQQMLGILKDKKKNLSKEIEDLDNLMKNELRKEKKVRKLRKQINFCSAALNVLKKTREMIMTEVRKNIEYRTKGLFFGLIWKKESFKDIKIDKNYGINLIHSMGYECLGTISGGERETLTLAFTLALHDISGFDSPIIVDRPLAMVSGDPRKSIVNVFSQISKNKQVILLFTPNDYSADISEILDPVASSRYRFDMYPGEKEIKLIKLEEL